MTLSHPHPPDPADRVTRLRLAALPSAVSAARRHTRRQLEEWRLGSYADQLLLAVSELVTNSVRAVGAMEEPASYAELYDSHVGTVLLRLRWTACGLVAEVWDSSLELPVLTQAEAFDEGGRGLALIAGSCDDWGCYPSRTGGKVVWCTLKTPGPAPGGW